MAKILIVEDNALNIKLFCDLLAAHGHVPQAVTDSRFAQTVDQLLGSDEPPAAEAVPGGRSALR